MIFPILIIYDNRFLLGVGTQSVGFAPTFSFGKNQVVETKDALDRVREMARKVAENESLEFVHAEIAGGGKNKIVRVFIDKEGGVTHDDCALVSSGLEKYLDAEAPLSGGYFLEVSSPGIERGLYSIEDFEKFAGNKARLKTYDPIDGQRNFRGTILSVRSGRIVFDDVTSGQVELGFEQVKKANLEFDIERELKAEHRARKRAR